MHYVKKPIVIEAIQWFNFGDHEEVKNELLNPPDNECKYCNLKMKVHGWIKTLEGGHIVCPGDFIIKGVKGEFYPCKEDIFYQTYDEVVDE